MSESSCASLGLSRIDAWSSICTLVDGYTRKSRSAKGNFFGACLALSSQAPLPSAPCPPPAACRRQSLSRGAVVKRGQPAGSGRGAGLPVPLATRTAPGGSPAPGQDLRARTGGEFAAGALQALVSSVDAFRRAAARRRGTGRPGRDGRGGTSRACGGRAGTRGVREGPGLRTGNQESPKGSREGLGREAPGTLRPKRP